MGDGLLSTGAAEALGLGYFELHGLLRERGIVIKTSDEEFERDQAGVRKMLAKLLSA